MKTESTTEPASEASLKRRVRPVAWIFYATNGNVRLWTFCGEQAARFAETHGLQSVPLYDIRTAPVAIMDRRDALGICAPTEADFPAIYALQGHRVALVDLEPNVGGQRRS